MTEAGNQAQTGTAQGNGVANASTGSGAQQNQNGAQDASNATPSTQYDSWESVLENLDADAVELYNSNVLGLKSALASERQSHKDLSKQLKDAMGKLEKGSEAGKQVANLISQLDIANTRVSFMEESSSHNVSNPKLLWLAVSQSADPVDVSKLDWDKLRSEYPELFKAVQASANAGAGSGASTGPFDMNAMIRQSAGRE